MRTAISILIALCATDAFAQDKFDSTSEPLTQVAPLIAAAVFIGLPVLGLRLRRPVLETMPGLGWSFATLSLGAGIAWILWGLSMPVPEISGIAILLSLAAIVALGGISYVRLAPNNPEVRRVEALIASGTNREQAAEDRLQAALRASPVGMIMVDARGTIRDINTAGLDMFGYDDKLIGESVDILIPGRWRERHAGYRHSYMAAPSNRAMGKGRELRGLHKSGREVPVEIALTAVPGGELVMATVVDITERMQLHQELERHALKLERSNKELDSFAYVASHDLKSPLRGIDHLCRFIEEDLGDSASEEVQDHLRMMRGRVDRMDRLLDDLLQYSRVGRGEHSVTDVNISDIIENIQQTLDVQKDFEIVVNGDLPTIVTYTTPLEQVLRNLIQNAIKHHDRSEGHVSISCDHRASPDMIALYVDDDGPGVPKEYRERVFRMFTTLTPRDKVEGSGIGLALVRKLVEYYGGTVWLEDAPGERGARFGFTWPRIMSREAI
ncbi:MAG: PAS domain S-box protein [Pseudomonadales bacterium]|nr:PAS domain S-box protein [Pseudomonadales bacterium]